MFRVLFLHPTSLIFLIFFSVLARILLRPCCLLTPDLVGTGEGSKLRVACDVIAWVACV